MMSKRKRKLPKKKYNCLFIDSFFVPCFFVVDPITRNVDKITKQALKSLRHLLQDF